jgi:hypothetical protein
LRLKIVLCGDHKCMGSQSLKKCEWKVLGKEGFDST